MGRGEAKFEAGPDVGELLLQLKKSAAALIAPLEMNAVAALANRLDCMLTLPFLIAERLQDQSLSESKTENQVSIKERARKALCANVTRGIFWAELASRAFAAITTNAVFEKQ